MLYPHLYLYYRMKHHFCLKAGVSLFPTLPSVYTFGCSQKIKWFLVLNEVLFFLFFDLVFIVSQRETLDSPNTFYSQLILICET